MKMALVPKHCAKNRHLLPDDAIYELKRARASVRNKPDDMIRHIVDDGSTDEAYKQMLLCLLTADDGAVPRKGKMSKNDVVEYREKHVVVRKRKRNESILERHDGRGRGRISEKNKLLRVKKETGVIKNSVKKEKHCENDVSSKKALVPLGNGHLHHEDNKGNIPLIDYQGELVAQARPVKVYRKQVGGKWKGVVKEEYETNVVVKKENEIYQGCKSRKCVARNVGQVQLGKKHAARGERGLMKVVRGGNGLASKKIVVGNFAVKKEPDDRVETRLPIEGVHNRTRNVQCAKGSMAYKNSNEKYLEGRVSSESVPEVEILDNDMVVKAGIVSPFISASRFDISVYDEKSKILSLPTAKDAFRKELLNILRKPYDKEEHQNIREAIQAGSYLKKKHHRGLQKKLKKCRYKREKRLVLLRGFLFWLQIDDRVMTTAAYFGTIHFTMWPVKDRLSLGKTSNALQWRYHS